jgi:AcrR family transcriptional regulator
LDKGTILRKPRRACETGAVQLEIAIGVREQKKARTRRALAEAALALFARDGFETTTVEDIAAACQVSARTFFRYFGAKEEVLWSDSEEYLARLVSGIRARPADEAPLLALRRAVLELADAYEGGAERVAIRNQVLANAPSLRTRAMEQQSGWEETVVDALSRRQVDADGAGASALHLRLVAGTGMAALRVAVDEWGGDRGRSLTSLIEEVFDQLAGGLDQAGHRAARSGGRRPERNERSERN